MKLKLWSSALVFLSSCAFSWGQVSVAISSPHSGESIAQIYQTEGSVASSAAAITNVSIFIDGTAYSPTTLLGAPPSGWLGAIYAKLMPVGSHTIVMKATDALGNIGMSQPVTVTVFHSNPACSHTMAGTAIYCEQAASNVQSVPTAALTFPHGYTAGETIIVGASANNRNVPWVTGSISNTAGYVWRMWGNIGSGNLDNNLVQVALWYTVVPANTTAPDTITVTSPGSSFTIEGALVYSGLGGIDGAGSAIFGWGGPGANATTGDSQVTPGDLIVAFTMGAPTAPVSGWGERLEDYARPYSMFIDRVATGATSNAGWTMNVEGFISISVAFKAQPGACLVN